MKGKEKKDMKRLWRATEKRTVYPDHWYYEDEITKVAKPIRGKSMRHLLAGTNYAKLESDSKGRYWFFSGRPKFNPSRLYYIEYVHKVDDLDFLYIRRAD